MSTDEALALTLFVASVILLASSLWMLRRAHFLCEGAQEVLSRARHDRRQSVEPWRGEERRRAFWPQ